MTYWFPKFQEWMTLSQAEYLKAQALDQAVVIRETPAHKVEQWTRKFEPQPCLNRKRS